MPLKVAESDAWQIANGIATLPPEDQLRAAGILDQYRAQQDAAGLPYWAETQKQKREEKQRVFDSVLDPKKLDAENGLFNEADRLTPGLGDTLRAKEANILFLSDRMGAPVEQVRKNYALAATQYQQENFDEYTPLDDKTFLGLAQGEIKREVEYNKVTDLARDAGYEAALQNADSAESLAKFQGSSKEATPAHAREFQAAYQAIQKRVEPYRQTIKEVVSQLQTEQTQEIQTYAEQNQAIPQQSQGVQRLMQLKRTDPKGYQIVLMALANEGRKTEQEDKSVVQGMGESLLRGFKNIDVGNQEAVSIQGARAAELLGFKDTAEEVRTRVAVLRDLRDVANGVIDPNKSMRDGILADVENAAYAFSGSAPSMLMAMSPVGRGLLVGSYTADAYADFRNAGWEGADAEAAAAGVGVFSAAVETASEVLTKVPGVNAGLSRLGMKPGSGWAAKYAIRSLGRGGAEITEEVLQDMAAAATQEWGQAIFSSIPDRPKGMALADEWANWTKRENFAPLAISILPLAMLGAGVAMRQEIAQVDQLTRNRQQIAAMLGDEVAGEVVKEKNPEKRVAMIQAAFAAQTPEQRLENIRKAAASPEYAEALTDQQLEDRLAYETTQKAGYSIKRGTDGWEVTLPAGDVVKTASAGEAVALMADHFSDVELRNASAVADMADMFISQGRGGERIEITPGKKRDIQDDVQEGVITPEQAREAIVTAGRLAGLTEAESVKQVGYVMGSSSIEENNGVREAVGRIYQGGNAITVIEEAVEGRLTLGLKEGHYSTRQFVNWVREAERATGETFMPENQSERDLVEAVSYITRADVLGRARDGSRLTPGLVSRGLVAARKEGLQAGKENGRLKVFLDSWRAWAKRVFGTAQKLKKARASGKLSKDFDSLMDDLLGLNPQERFNNEVEREAMDWVDPDSVKYTPPDDGSFSIVPRSLAATIQSKAEKMMGDPEQRARILAEMVRRLGKVRLDTDQMADLSRSKGSLETEARFRQRSRQRDLLREGMDNISPNVMQAYEAGLQSLEDHPLVSALLNDVGKLMSKTTAAKTGKKFVGEYDGAPWLPPSWYAKTGGLGPDTAAQALYERGLINDPSPDAMWDALRSVIDTSRMANEAAREAKTTVRDIEKSALKLSKEEADRWYEDRLTKIPTSQEKIVAAFRTLDAMTSILPPEVRGKLGGVTQLAKLKTDEALAKALESKLDKIDKVLEKYMRDDFTEQLDKLLDSAAKTGKGGEKAMGTLGVAGHRWFAQVAKAVEMTEQAAQDEMAKLEAIMADPAREASEQEDAFETWGILHQFGGFYDKSAAEMESAVAAARKVYSEGREAWKAILNERKEERQKLRDEAFNALGGKANIADIQQGSLVASKKAEAKSLRHWFDQHFSFAQMMGAIFGQKSKVAEYFEKKARNATKAKTDAMIDRIREYKTAMLAATNAKTWKQAQDKLYELQAKDENAPVRFFADSSQKTLDVPGEIVERLIEGTITPKVAGVTDEQAAELAELWADARSKSKRERVFKVKQKTEGRALGKTSISQLEAVHFTMLAKQEQYRKAMDLHGLTEESLADMEAWLSPEAKAVRSWLFSQYDKGYGSLNEVYKRMFGIDMPRVKEYAPGYFETEGKVSELDPFGTGIEATGIAAGFLKKRKQHMARPVQVDALQAYWQHIQQVEHWKAWAEVTSEMRAVLGNVDVLGTVRAKKGEGNARDVLSWIDALEKNGIKDAQASVMLSKILRAQARIALAYKVGVLMKQLPAMLGSLSDVPAGEWIKSAAKVLAGQGQIPLAEMWQTPAIQRRVESGYSPEMRNAMRGPMAKPDFLGDVLEFGMQGISKTDAAFTTFSAAVAYDAHYRAAIETGATADEAAAIAMEQTEQTIGRTAQPGELMDRSLVELKAQGLGKLLFQFQSAQRQAWALSYAAATGLVKGDVKFADASRVLFTQFVLIPAITQTMAGLIRYLFSDDEPEELWKPADYARAMLMGPSSGIMLFGAAIDVLGSKFSPRSNNPLSTAVGDMARLYSDWQNDRDISANDIGSAISASSLLLSGVVPGSVEAAGVTWSILKQILGLSERVEEGA